MKLYVSYLGGIGGYDKGYMRCDMPVWRRAVILLAIGANLGNSDYPTPLEACLAAVLALRALPGVTVGRSRAGLKARRCRCPISPGM